MYKSKDHVFVICAYKQSPYLQECISSLRRQNIQSNVIMVTSTPNAYIADIAEKNHISLYINEGESGIAGDWNFAYETAAKFGSMITIAHQDDIYDKNYLWNILRMANRSHRPLIAFCNYGELRDGEKVDDNKLLRVKRLMLLPLRFRPFFGSVFIRRRILSFGSPICCPSVCYFKDNLPPVLFQKGFYGAVDWQCWERISRRPGSFVYVPWINMYHRIHQESETSRIIENKNRSKEDLAMYKKFWPTPIAMILEHFYNKGEASNQL